MSITFQQLLLLLPQLLLVGGGGVVGGGVGVAVGVAGGGGGGLLLRGSSCGKVAGLLIQVCLQLLALPAGRKDVRGRSAMTAVLVLARNVHNNVLAAELDLFRQKSLGVCLARD